MLGVVRVGVRSEGTVELIMGKRSLFLQSGKSWRIGFGDRDSPDAARAGSQSPLSKIGRGGGQDLKGLGLMFQQSGSEIGKSSDIWRSKEGKGGFHGEDI